MRVAYDPGVPFRRDPRILGPKRSDNLPQTEINPRSEERRPDSQTANLHQERILVPLVLPAKDASRVPNHLGHDPQHHGHAKQVRPARAGHGVREPAKGQGKQDEKGDVCGEGDAVRIERDYPLFAVLEIGLEEAKGGQPAGKVNFELVDDGWGRGVFYAVACGGEDVV